MKLSAEAILWLEKYREIGLCSQKPFYQGLFIGLAILVIIVLTSVGVAIFETGPPKAKEDNLFLNSIEDIPGDPRGRVCFLCGF